MKKALYSLLIFFAFAGQVFASDQTKFCDGFKAGYLTGYKQAAQVSLNPLLPMCPLEPMKTLNDPSSDFEFGYLKGLDVGAHAGKVR